MSLVVTQPITPKRKSRLNLWFERMMVIILLFNYLLVLFDYSYIPYRDFWQQGKVQLYIKTPVFKMEFPEKPIRILPFNITKIYDGVKGIVPNQETVQYLDKVNELNNAVEQQGLDIAQTASISNTEIDKIFADLGSLSADMIALNSFVVADKSGTLEVIKNRMRRHIFATEKASAQTAFQVFWSRDHFIREGFRQEANFFAQEIQPLMQTNYFRPLGENGKPINNFFVLDFPFITLFFLEFLLRTWIIARHYTGVSWFDAMLWRWYDIFLFLPILRWLRIIPLLIRLNQAKFISLQKVQRQVNLGFVTNIAEDVTQVVMIRVINQLQTSIGQGDIQNFLMSRNRQSIDLNNNNEIAEIFKILFQIIVEKVMPQIKPDAEALLKYNFEKALSQTFIYQDLQQFPGIKNLQEQLSKQFASQSYQAFSETLSGMMKDDPKFEQLFGQLLDKFSQTMETELESQKSFNQLESLLTVFLEEFKINYLKPLSAEDLEIILEQTRALRSTVTEPTVFEPKLIRRFS